ncbi:RimJ/RimL family protein N-acetyltransferase [Paraburkholderia sp. MM5496-R1]
MSNAIDHVFSTLQLHRVMANYRPDNLRSARLLERLGFENEGLARAYPKIDGA